MEKAYKFAIEDIKRFGEDENPEFAIAEVSFLSTRPNSHGMVLTEDVLRKYAPTVLGKPLIGQMNFLGTDVKSHEHEQNIFGWAPTDQEVRFEKDEDDYLVAKAQFVISKLYATNFYGLFSEEDNYHSVSVEMMVGFEVEDGEDTDVVESLHITGVTVLGKTINPSVPKANIQIIQFSEDKANEYYHNTIFNNGGELQKFMEEKKKKSYKIDKSKESLSEDSWGDVDKADMRDKIMDAKNRATLVKSVYLLVEDGWEDAPSEHLKYPVMQLKEDTFVYNRGALASAKAYAEQHDETKVLSKLSKIYDKLDLNKEEERMAEFTMSAVDIQDLWCRLYDQIECGYCIEGIYEENGQKFVIVCDREGSLYRIDFSFAEDGKLELANEKTKVAKEFVELSEVLKFAEPEEAELSLYKEIKAESKEEEKEDDEENDDESEEEDDEVIMEETAEEKLAKKEAECEEMSIALSERDEKIAQYEVELAELREFKANVQEAEKTQKVNALLAQFKGKVSDDEYAKFEADAKEVKFENFDGWKNGVLATFGELMLQNNNVIEENKEDITRMSVPENEMSKKKGLWD